MLTDLTVMLKWGSWRRTSTISALQSSLPGRAVRSLKFQQSLSIGNDRAMKVSKQSCPGIISAANRSNHLGIGHQAEQVISQFHQFLDDESAGQSHCFARLGASGNGDFSAISFGPQLLAEGASKGHVSHVGHEKQSITAYHTAICPLKARLYVL